MDRLNVDLGIEEFALGNGVLRFNPADPNLYARFLELEPQLQQLQQELTRRSEEATDVAQVLQLLAHTDRQFKDLLTGVFGGNNDFSRLLEGVNLLSAASDGHSVGENLLGALAPVLTQGAERFVQMQTQAALEKARHRRENQ